MSKRPKQTHGSDRPQDNAGANGPRPADQRPEGWWTRDFARPRVAMALLGGLALYSIFIFLFLANGVMAVDRAAVLWAAGCVLGLGIIHPALALAFLAFIRHWIDGMTYPADNTYFLWAILYLFALWAIRLLFQGGRLRFGTPALLLGGFTFLAFLSTFDTVQYENSFNSLLMWCSYLALFVLAANSLRAPLALTIALGGVMAAFYAQSAYSILHYDYVLPYVRKMIMEDPALLRQYFNTDQLTPELAHRLARNRAFGTMLFPNALAALLILGIPAAFFGVWYQWRHFRDSLAPQGTPRNQVIATALGAWGITLLFNFALVWFHSVFSYPDEGALQHPIPWIGGVGILPLAAGAAMAAVAQRKSTLHAWRLGATAALGVTGVAATIALFLSKSRGGILALVLALAFCIILLILANRRAYGRLPAFLERWIAPRPSGGHDRGVAVQAPAKFVAEAWSLQPMLRALITLALLGATAASLVLAIPVAAQDPTPAAPVLEAENTGPVAAAPKPPQITEAGVNLELEDLVGLSTLSIRLTYWNVARLMAFDNFFSGVGIGNFGVAYPKYQYLGAGDVQTAHNDYLQYFAETGIFGFLFFCGFVLWFVLWGARRILREESPIERWMLAGLYGGVLAFFLHSAVDFNFNNPALVFFAMLLAGAFCARAERKLEPELLVSGNDTAHRAIALPALLIVALIFGFSFRTYYQDFMISKDTDGTSWLNVGNYKKLDRRYAVANFFLTDGPTYNRLRKDDPNVQPPVIPVEAARLFLPTRKEMEAVGDLRVPLPGNRGSRPVNRSEHIPQNALLVITRPWDAYLTAQPNIEAWVQRLIAFDSVFPHNAEFADHIAQWYSLLWGRLPNKQLDRLDPFLRQEIVWHREAVERSPLQPGYHIALAQALWAHAERRTDPARLELYEEGFRHYNKALEIYPISVEVNAAYASGLHFMAYVSDRLGDPERAAEFRQRQQDQEAFIKRLVETRSKLGLP
jgi:hypothetical protein